jgi:general secretion pathway protein D
MMEALLPIPQVISIEEANEIGRAVQQVLDIKRLAVDAARRQVYVRDTVSRVRLAQALYEELSRRRGEVMLEIELLGVSRSNLTNLGLTTATGFVAAQGSGGHVTLGGGETLFGIQIADSNFEASASRSESRLLTSVRLRATDGLPASMHIGDHYPIVNAVFSPIVFTDQIRNLQQSGQLRPPFPSFTFEDLGLVLKVTPRIHDSQEVSLSLEAAFRLLSGDSLNGIPVIADRKFTSAVRLREGQTSIISGLVVSQVARSRSGLAGLLLLSHNTWQFDYNELLVTITPRLISLPPAEQFPQRAFYYGTDLRPISPL